MIGVKCFCLNPQQVVAHRASLSTPHRFVKKRENNSIFVWTLLKSTDIIACKYWFSVTAFVEALFVLSNSLEKLKSGTERAIVRKFNVFALTTAFSRERVRAGVNESGV